MLLTVRMITPMRSVICQIMRISNQSKGKGVVTHLLHNNPRSMPSGLRVNIGKGKHGEQHECISRDADCIDLGDTKSLAAIGILDRFLQVESLVSERDVAANIPHTRNSTNQPLESWLQLQVL